MGPEVAARRVGLFNAVRDIPYRLPLTLQEENHACVGKGLKLKRALEALGDPVRWKEGEFRWEDMSLPATLLEIRHDEHPTHVWLEVWIDGTWVVVDPTWDIGLQHICPVNTWDGTSSQKIAFPILRMIPDDQVEILDEPLPEWETDIAHNRGFFAAVNTWFVGQREKQEKERGI